MAWAYASNAGTVENSGVLTLDTSALAHALTNPSCLIMFFEDGSGNDPNAFDDNSGGSFAASTLTWTKVRSDTDGSGWLQGMYYALNNSLTTASYQLRVKWGSGTGYKRVALLEYTGLDTTAPLVGAGTNNTANSNAPASGSNATSGNNNCLVIGGCLSLADANGPTASGSETRRISGATLSFCCVEDIDSGTSANITLGMSTPTGNQWGVTAAVFKQPGAGAASSLPSLPLLGAGQ